MALRESTIPQICNCLRHNPSLPGQLKALVQGMIKKAKGDLDDFYSEVTFRSQRKRDFLKGKGGANEDKKEKKKRRHESEEEEDEEEEEKEEKEDEKEDEKEEEEESSDDEETKSVLGSNDNEKDSDIFMGRFSTPEPAIPKQNSGSDSSSGAGGKFKKSLREMINQAMACGALPADPRLAEPPNRPFISDLQNQDLFSNFGES